MSYRIVSVDAEYNDRSTGLRQVVAELYADTAMDLPSNTASLEFLLGSTATVVDTASKYAVKSDGTWVVQPTSGGGGGIEVIEERVWQSYSSEQKRSYGLVAIQTSNSGYERGLLVFGADYDGYTVIDSGWAVSSKSYTFDTSGKFKLFVIALNSEASTQTLSASCTVNNTAISGTVLDSNANHHGTPPNERNYKITAFDIEVAVGDVLDINVQIDNNYSSFVYAIIDTNVNTVSKSLTTADSYTSGSYSENGIVMYGTFSGNTSGTINIEHYDAEDVITTDNAGYGYKSSYIFWFTVSS